MIAIVILSVLAKDLVTDALGLILGEYAQDDMV